MNIRPRNILAMLFFFLVQASFGGERVEPTQYVTPNFQNVDVALVARSVTEVTGRVIVVTKNINKRMSLKSEEKLTPEDYYQLFVRILRSEGLQVDEDPNRTLVSN